MPEGDAVWRTARRLHQALARVVLEGSDLRVPTLATSDLSGRRTLEVVPRGKHLLHRLEGDLTLHSHLRMEGSWRVHPVARRRSLGARHTVRALLWTGERVAVGDSLGVLDLVRTAEEERVVGHLGPDLLDPGYDAAQALANLLDRPDRPVGEALLDQRVVAGLGTIWTAEPLFEQRVDPWTPVGDVGEGRLGQVLHVARRMLVTSCRSTHPVRHQVYGKAGRPCPRCGTTLRSDPVGAPPRERQLVHCPGCQGRPRDKRRTNGQHEAL